MSSQPQRLAFAPLTGAVDFHDGSEVLLDTLDAILVGWPRHPAEDGAPARIQVRRAGGDFVIDSPWLDTPLRDPSALRAAGNLAVDLVEQWLDEHPDTLCLHCGAALFGDQLVIFPAQAHAGKSTLMARLAAAGIPIFTDDILPLVGDADEDGFSLGLQARPRLPLPPSAGTALQRLVADCAPVRDERYAYIQPAAGIGPVFGRRARIGAIVLLERTADASSPARLEPAHRGDGLQELIFQNLSPELHLPDSIARLHRLMARLPCFRLRYNDLEEASALLSHRFPVQEDSALSPAPVASAAPPDTTRAGYARTPDVTACHADDELFLVNAQGNRVFRLNPLANGVWNLLAEPATRADIIDALHTAFPCQSRTRIAHDVTRLIEQLLTHGLIRTPVPRAPRPTPLT